MLNLLNIGVCFDYKYIRIWIHKVGNSPAFQRGGFMNWSTVLFHLDIKRIVITHFKLNAILKFKCFFACIGMSKTVKLVLYRTILLVCSGELRTQDNRLNAPKIGLEDLVVHGNMFGNQSRSTWSLWIFLHSWNQS